MVHAPTTTTSISLCMIVKNEEEHLEKCLNSVKELVDEIVIVDTGSSDSTKKIAKRYTDKVFDFKWVNNFSKARNESLKHATKDWILVLDADEVINQEDHAKIKQAIHKADERTGGVSLIQRTYTHSSNEKDFVPLQDPSCVQPYLVSVEGFIPRPITRLFRNNKAFQFQNTIHELIEPSITKTHKIQLTTIPFHHFELLKSGQFRAMKRKFYLDLAQKKLQEQPEDPKAYYELAVMMLSAQKYNEAKELLEKAVRIDKQYVEASVDLIYAYAKLGREEPAKKLFEAVTSVSEDPQAYFHLAVLYYDKKEYQQALDLLKKTLELRPYHVQANYLTAILLLKHGKFEEARVFLVRTCKLDPKKAEAQLNLGVVEHRLGNVQKAIQHLNTFTQLKPERKDVALKIKALEQQVALMH
jgi:glycosyltransferase involved in cell wall biosynthesis